jgi:hypothetical protein
MIDWSPVVALSQDGRAAAIAVNTELLLVDTESGATEEWSGSDAATVVALAPTRRGTAVTAAGSTLQTPLKGGATASLAGRVIHARVTDGGIVAALTRSDNAGTALVILRADGLEEIATVQLGNVSARGMELDEASTTATLWGRRGDRPWDGFGEPYVQQLAFGDGDVEVRWSASGVPEAAVDGIRIGGGNLVASSEDRLMSCDLDVLVAGGIVSATTVTTPDPVHLLAISPGGRFVALTIYGEPTSRVFSAPFGGELVERGTIPDTLEVEAIAVDDDGRVVICGLDESDTVDIAVAPPGSPLQQHRKIEIPESGTFGDIEPD